MPCSPVEASPVRDDALDDEVRGEVTPTVHLTEDAPPLGLLEAGSREEMQALFWTPGGFPAPQCSQGSFSHSLAPASPDCGALGAAAATTPIPQTGPGSGPAHPTWYGSEPSLSGTISVFP